MTNSEDGTVFDYGNTTYKELKTGQPCISENENGNGSLMRILPLAFVDCTDDEIRAVNLGDDKFGDNVFDSRRWSAPDIAHTREFWFEDADDKLRQCWLDNDFYVNSI